jgi:hypothetical protein
VCRFPDWTVDYTVQKGPAGHVVQAHTGASQLESIGYESASSDAEYTNHYNSKMGKCFIEMTVRVQMKSDLATIWTNKFLSDAYEGKAYGNYSWHTVQGKKYWEVPPVECSMFPDGTDGSLQRCTSEAEFDAFVAKYMGDEQ